MSRARPRVALATCRVLPEWEVDDRPLRAALAARGVDVVEPAWDDPAFDWATCDACLVRTTWDYTERVDEYVAWARRVAAVTPLFNPPEVVEWNTRKTYLRDLEERGAPVVPTVWLERGAPADPEPLLAARGWRRAFLKPVVGATARETLRFTADPAGLAAARRHLERLSPDEPMMLQPYLGRVETEGELSFLFLDGRFSHAVRKLPPAGDYRVQDDFGATDERIEPAPADLRLARSVVERCGFPDLLYARVDLLADDDGALRVTELELVEPSLFLRHRPRAAEELADALLRRTATTAGRR